MFTMTTGNGGRRGRGRMFFARMIAILASFGAATGAAQARDLEEDDEATSAKAHGQMSDAELMYRAMKRSNRDSKDDVAIDRAIARARADSEHRKRALRDSMSTWRDPFADPPDRSDRGNASPRQRQNTRRTDEELRAAKSEAARARWEAAAARAEAASARAEAADAKVDAARAEAAAARAQFVASRQSCGVLDPPKPRRPTVASRGPREDARASSSASGDWMPAMRRASAHSSAPRRLPTSSNMNAASSPSAAPRPAAAAPVTPAPAVAARAPEPAAATPPATARPAPTGIIVVPIPPPPETDRSRRRN